MATQNVPDIFIPLQDAINKSEGMLTELLCFIEYLKKHQFDQADIRHTVQVAQKHNTNLERMQMDLKSKCEIYTEQVCKLEDSIKRRKHQLDNFQNAKTLYKNFPEILQFFVDKQVKLQSKLSNIQAVLTQKP